LLLPLQKQVKCFRISPFYAEQELCAFNHGSISKTALGKKTNDRNKKTKKYFYKRPKRVLTKENKKRLMSFTNVHCDHTLNQTTTGHNAQFALVSLI